MLNGRIVESGGWELTQLLEAEGYDPIREKHGIEETSQVEETVE